MEDGVLLGYNFNIGRITDWAGNLYVNRQNDFLKEGAL
jgi:hypothetical protein